MVKKGQSSNIRRKTKPVEPFSSETYLALNTTDKTKKPKRMRKAKQDDNARERGKAFQDRELKE